MTIPQEPLHTTVTNVQGTWRDILWRAWRSCEDQECATQLFTVVADEAETLVGCHRRLWLMLCGALAGIMAGLIIGSVVGTRTFYDGRAGLSWFGMLSTTAGWGGLGGLLVGWSLTPRLSWRGWFTFLGPASLLDPEAAPGRHVWRLSVVMGYVQGGLLAMAWLIGAKAGALLMLTSIAGHALKAWLAPHLWPSIGRPARYGQNILWKGLALGWKNLGRFALYHWLLPAVCLTLAWQGFTGEVGKYLMILLLMSLGIECLRSPIAPGSEVEAHNQIGVMVWWNPLTMLSLYFYFSGVSGAAILVLFWPTFLDSLVAFYTQRHSTGRTPWRGVLQHWHPWRPLPDALEGALQQACNICPAVHTRWADILALVTAPRQPSETPETLVAALQSDQWSTRLRARHTLVRLGGEAVTALQPVLEQPDKILRQTARGIFLDIAADTTARLGCQKLSWLCPRCLVRCGPHAVRLASDQRCTWYGCRACGQSHEGIALASPVINTADHTLRAIATARRYH